MSHAFLVEVGCISRENSAHFLEEFGGYLLFLVKKNDDGIYFHFSDKKK